MWLQIELSSSDNSWFQDRIGVCERNTFYLYELESLLQMVAESEIIVSGNRDFKHMSFWGTWWYFY